METIVSGVVGVLVWVVANVVYADKRRRATRGFARFLAFWMGLPGTLLALFLVQEGSQPALDPPPDDEDALLAEVRQRRMGSIGPSGGETRPGHSEEES